MRGRYNGYRGKTQSQDTARRILVLLIVLLFLAAAGLMAVQQYIVYTDSGIRLDLPFFRQETPAVPDETRSLEVERRAEPSEENRPGEQDEAADYEW